MSLHTKITSFWNINRKRLLVDLSIFATFHDQFVMFLYKYGAKYCTIELPTFIEKADDI